MKYPLMPGQTVEYLVLHALESCMVDNWGIRKFLMNRGPQYILEPRQISGALQRLKRDGIVTHLNDGERDRWKLVHNVELRGGAQPYRAASLSSAGLGDAVSPAPTFGGEEKCLARKT